MSDNATVGDVVAAVGPLPRVTIQFCTQCKWMLRAAYVALQPSTGGTFIVTIDTADTTAATNTTNTIRSTLLWDRRNDGGFPETKELKRRVRDVIEPGRHLGHVDHHGGGPSTPAVHPAGVPVSSAAPTPATSAPAPAPAPAVDDETAQTPAQSEDARSGAPRDCQDCQ
ncbi:Rdx family [Geosmithia morbida]|uniref:Rdx family n=1 Tax=Geosmithia morbida TaxID=1094350 RepID=A0A9P4YSY2_9HYPO|nr:Rdx family [Geosmithia morbida]KAF4121209.1 Rdx family [Geosmithia morbida]